MDQVCLYAKGNDNAGCHKKATEFPGHSASQEGLCFTERVTGQRASTNAVLLGLLITLLVMRRNFLYAVK